MMDCWATTTMLLSTGGPRPSTYRSIATERPTSASLSRPSSPGRFLPPALPPRRSAPGVQNDAQHGAADRLVTAVDQRRQPGAVTWDRSVSAAASTMTGTLGGTGDPDDRREVELVEFPGVIEVHVDDRGGVGTQRRFQVVRPVALTAPISLTSAPPMRSICRSAGPKWTTWPRWITTSRRLVGGPEWPRADPCRFR